MSPHAEADAVSSNGDGPIDTNGFHESVGPAPVNPFFKVSSPNVEYTDDEILSKYVYRTTSVTQGENGERVATPTEKEYNFKVDRRVPKVGLMLVGWGGNNGSTLTAAILANRRKLSWEDARGPSDRQLLRLAHDGVNHEAGHGRQDQPGRQHSLNCRPAHDPPQQPGYWRLGYQQEVSSARGFGSCCRCWSRR